MAFVLFFFFTKLHDNALMINWGALYKFQPLRKTIFPQMKNCGNFVCLRLPMSC